MAPPWSWNHCPTIWDRRDWLSLFIAHPWLAAIIGAGFLVAGLQKPRWGVVTVGVMWELYFLYETGMQRRWLCTGECNIRVDLLLIYPVLLLASIVGVWKLR